jgi:predicted nucleotidyltransferase
MPKIIHTTPIIAPTKSKLIIDTLKAALPSILAIYAFGSQVQGTAGKDSDLDLAVLVAGYAEPLVLWELANRLADTIGCEVDLLDLRAASTVMQAQILRTGYRLWARQPETDLFEVYVLSEKTALDEARAGLLADIQRRGSIYG